MFATPTQVSVHDVTPGHDLTTVTRMDTRVRAIQSRQPMAGATDPGATNTVYYTGDTTAPGTACDSRPEWAGLVCQVGPASQPGTGPTLPTTVTTYTRDLNTGTEVETSGPTVRTTTTSYDNGGRVATTAVGITGAPSGNQAVPTTTSTYWPETGLTKSVSNGTATATTTYNSQGRVTSQTDGAGNTATTEYDTAGRVWTTNDGKALSTYTYNGTDAAGQVEYRGLVTAKSVAGLVGATAAFTAAYEADGGLDVEV